MKSSVFRRVSTAALAAALSLSMVQNFSLPQAVSADVNDIYEFEDGVFANCEYNEGIAWTVIDEDAEGNSCDMTGWSGDGYAYLDRKGASIAVTVTVEETGIYELLVNYIQCFDVDKKVQYLNVNGVNQGDVSFPFNSGEGWTLMSAGYVLLEAGTNTIAFEGYWGYTFLDYLQLRTAPSYLTNLNPTDTLSNPNADERTRALYQYLQDQYGQHIIAGQQENCGSHCYNLNAYESSGKTDFSYFEDNEEEFKYLYNLTGKYPAIRGIDMLTYNSSTTYRDGATERIIEWYDQWNGIPTVTWHWSVPSEEGGTDAYFYVESASANYTTFSISRALTEGTWEHEVLMADIAVLATEFQKVEDAGVPFIFRPLHEAEGAWFWWGAEGPEYCKELYRLLYDQLTNVYGLDNLIWEWTSYTYTTSPSWYPGDDVVDLIGYDKYNAVDFQYNLSAISATFFSLVGSTEGEKMVCMSENDTIPSLENIQKEAAGWLYFCPWYGYYITNTALNPAETVTEMYQSDYCITLEELPDLKTYSAAPAQTTTGIPSAQSRLWGDADLDNQVKMSDVILLTKTLNDSAVLEEQGKQNADVDADGTPNAADVSRIMLYLSGQISYEALSPSTV